MKIFTIGYGGRHPSDFVTLLTEAGVRCVADVREVPRGSMGSYTKAKTPDKGIEALLAPRDIEYRWLPELGNPWRKADGWEKNYRGRLKNEGKKRTEALLALPRPFCLLCAEKDPADCHRSILSDYLEEAWDGVKVEHL